MEEFAWVVGNSHFFHRGGLIEKGRGLLIGCWFDVSVSVGCLGMSLLFRCGFAVSVSICCLGVSLLSVCCLDVRGPENLCRTL